MFKHILPNSMVATLTFLPFKLSGSISALTALDFLGLGLPPGSPSLGEMLTQATANLQAPWLGLAAFFSIAVLLSLLIFIGEGVRERTPGPAHLLGPVVHLGQHRLGRAAALLDGGGVVAEPGAENLGVDLGVELHADEPGVHGLGQLDDFGQLLALRQRRNHQAGLAQLVQVVDVGLKAVAVALGADPATILAAVTPVPDAISEYQFAGLLRGGRTEIVKCLTHDLEVPASAEIVLEGHLRPDANDPTGYETAAEGPFGDHTGYYNEQDWFPVFRIDRLTHRRDPIYHSTYTGKPPDEPAVLGVALNEVFVPILQKQFPELSLIHI